MQQKDSKKDRYPIETLITFAPVTPDPQEENAGCPEDLFACAETGQFFTVKNMKVDVISRTVSPSKSFLCPVCNIPLTIVPSQQRQAGDPVAKCKSCKWDTSRCNVLDMGDLLQRVKMPFPWLESHYRLLKTSRITDKTGSNKMAGRHVMTRRLDPHQPSLGDGAAFVMAQAAHEKKVFKGFMPPSQNTTVRGRPAHDIKEMCADIDSNGLMDEKERRAEGIWFKNQGGPVQRVRLPHVIIKSAFTETVVNPKWDTTMGEGDNLESTAAYVLPKVTISIKEWKGKDDECGAHNDETDILISVRNERQLSATVNITNWINKSQALDFKIGAGEQVTKKMKGVKWSAQRVRHREWLNDLCDHLLQFEMQVRYDMKFGNHSCSQRTINRWQRLSRNTWHVSLFIRHGLRNTETSQ